MCQMENQTKSRENQGDHYPGSESPKGGRQKRQRVENEEEGKVG